MNFDETPTIGSGSSGDGGKELFLKLKDGESVRGLFQGEPRVFTAIWDGQTYVETPKADGGKFRFSVNILVEENGKWTAKIFEQGAVVYSSLKDLNEEYPLEDTLVKITRNGEKTETTYSILPVPPKAQPDEKTLKKIKEIPLHSLEKKKPLTNHAAKFNEAETLPF
jgi:hypothetical protein